MRARVHHPQLVVADRLRVEPVGAGSDLLDHRGQFLSGPH
jgi:hypothetical protein